MAAFCARVEQSNLTLCGGACSVLLLGSLSKGEGTVFVREGEEAMAGDVELLTVYPRGLSGISALMAAIDTAARETLSPVMPHGVRLDNCAVTVQSLPRLDKKLLIYDAARYGVLLTGADVRPLLPRISYDTLNREDVADIVSHRLMAVLRETAGNDEQCERYCLAKNALDLATVWLYARGVLQTTVQGRMEALRERMRDEQLLLGMESCAAIKRGESTPLSTAALRLHFCTMAQCVSGAVRQSPGSVWQHWPALLRRRLGRLRRAIRYRHVARSARAHEAALLSLLLEGGELHRRHLRDHLVLHGYPLPHERVGGPGGGNDETTE